MWVAVFFFEGIRGAARVCGCVLEVRRVSFLGKCDCGVLPVGLVRWVGGW